jgi:hypothetical protein
MLIKNPLIIAGFCLAIYAGYKVSMKTLNVRNNNPLNIRFNENNQWNGQTGQSFGFAVFESPEYGFRAAYKLISTYQTAYDLYSVKEIISRWAPASENDTQGYIDFITEKLNKWEWTPVTRQEIAPLLYYMSQFEGAKDAFTIEQVNAGIGLA